MKTEKRRAETKNLKISPKHHLLLKRYCDSKGLKMFKFVEKLIEEKCKKEVDLYGDDYK
jgi:hypothetical protein